MVSLSFFIIIHSDELGTAPVDELHSSYTLLDRYAHGERYLNGTSYSRGHCLLLCTVLSVVP